MRFERISKNNSYPQIESEFVYGPDIYSMRKSDGELHINTVKLGVAQKLLNNDNYCFSLGITGSLD